MIEIGTIIQELREERNISRKNLAKGICSESMLVKLERGERTPEVECIDMLLQRMGKSPDKLEIIISEYSYCKIELYDEMIDALRHGEYEGVVERLCLFEKKYCKNAIDKMLAARIHAIIAYQRDKNYEQAERMFDGIVTVTQSEIDIEKIKPFSISTIEMENLLMRCFIWTKDGRREKAEQWLKVLNGYINTYFSDEEERIKLLPKVNYLLATLFFKKQDYLTTLEYCEEALELAIDQFSVSYVTSLMELLAKSYICLGEKEKSKKITFYTENIKKIYAEYKVDIRTLDVLYYSASMRQYILDSELIREIRLADDTTQFTFIDGLYSDPTSISRLENGKTKINNGKLIQILEKYKVNKGRYNCCLVTQNFEVLESWAIVQKLISGKRYDEAVEMFLLMKEQIDITNNQNKVLIDFGELRFDILTNKINLNIAKEQLTNLLEEVGLIKNGKISRRPFPIESSIIAELEFVLYSLKEKTEAIKLLEDVLYYYNNSKIKDKYYFRSSSLLQGNLIVDYISRGDREQALAASHVLIKEALHLGRMMFVSSFLKSNLAAMSTGAEPSFLKHANLAYYLHKFYGLNNAAESIRKRYLKD